jgi:hypothetical protein
MNSKTYPQTSAIFQCSRFALKYFLELSKFLICQCLYRLNRGIDLFLSVFGIDQLENFSPALRAIFSEALFLSLLLLGKDGCSSGSANTSRTGVSSEFWVSVQRHADFPVFLHEPPK